MKRILAAFIFFTRLPFWRLGEVPAELYKRVVELWPMVGYLTGGIAALVFWLAAEVAGLPPLTAAALAYAARLLVTGALHEDGLADFFDGMGGGTDRQRILAIMKDSHIGTYGVIGLTMWFLLVIPTISALPVATGCIVILAADVWSKCCAAQIINFLPYARKESEAKNKTVYSRMAPGPLALCFLAGVIPLILLASGYWAYIFAALGPVFVTTLIICLLRKKIQGYTGDCCGALFLLNELTFILVASAIFSLHFRIVL